MAGKKMTAAEYRQMKANDPYKPTVVKQAPKVSPAKKSAKKGK